MKREILVSTDPREIRLALLEDGQVMEVKVEREASKVGSIYKGMVEAVLPGMDSAFVDVGLERNAFLHASDACVEQEGEGGEGGGNGSRGGGRHRRRRIPPIKDLVQPKQELMLQLTKAPIGDKGARVTTRISLPGRWVVLLPVGANYVGVSKKIEDEEERARLKEIGHRHRPRGQGIIVRTEAYGCEESEIAEDIEMLKALWRKLRARYRSRKAPALVHEDLGLTERMIRDYYNDDVTRVLVDTKVEYDRVLEALRNISPAAAKKAKLYREKASLFEAHGVEAALRDALERKVRLPSGGNITVDETEAIVAIDVNTGRFIGSKGRGLSDTILKTNLEAAREIPRQLRLRDLGGIIVLDFIDMYNADHKRQVMETLEERLKRDRTRTRVVHLSPLGLVEMTRKRTGQSLLQSSCDVCTRCGGRGRALSPESLAARVERDLKQKAGQKKVTACLLVVPPEVGFEIVGRGGVGVEVLEKDLGVALYVRTDPNLTADQYRIEAGARQDIEQQLRILRHGQMFHVRPTRAEVDGETVTLASVEGMMVEIDTDKDPDDLGDLVTVSLSDIGRSWARGTLLE